MIRAAATVSRKVAPGACDEFKVAKKWPFLFHQPFIGNDMQLMINPTDVRWWFWMATLAFIVSALAGWTPAYYVAMAISAAQAIFFVVQEKSLAAFPSQIRIVYFALTLFGLWPGMRWYIYLVLLAGTIMVTFFGRCSIALVLKHMPWNRGREVRLY